MLSLIVGAISGFITEVGIGTKSRRLGLYSKVLSTALRRPLSSRRLLLQCYSFLICGELINPSYYAFDMLIWIVMPLPGEL